MSDKVIKIGKSVIQHGNENDRVYIMKISKDDIDNVINKIEELNENFRYSKIFAKVPGALKNIFLAKDFKIEAEVPNFFNGNEDCFFMGKYFSKEREINVYKEETNNVIKVANEKSTNFELDSLDGYVVKKMTLDDSKEMVEIYKQVFESYPFPIFEEYYIKETMNDNVIYFGVYHNDKLVALSSSETYPKDSNAEMTDFATLPEYRGKDLALRLLKRMEEELKELNIKMAYTIARSISYGMNITFSKNGYKFGGTLINNTNISGKIENMNVWYKSMVD